MDDYTLKAIIKGFRYNNIIISKFPLSGLTTPFLEAGTDREALEGRWHNEHFGTNKPELILL